MLKFLFGEDTLDYLIYASNENHQNVSILQFTKESNIPNAMHLRAYYETKITPKNLTIKTTAWTRTGP